MIICYSIKQVVFQLESIDSKTFNVELIRKNILSEFIKLLKF